LEQTLTFTAFSHNVLCLFYLLLTGQFHLSEKIIKKLLGVVKPPQILTHSQQFKAPSKMRWRQRFEPEVRKVRQGGVTLIKLALRIDCRAARCAEEAALAEQ
jgi:hypothetical protein